MERTLVIGASGNIGKQLTRFMLNDGRSVVALVRDKSKLKDITDDNLSVIEGDLTNDFSHAFERCNNVVFVAGSGGSTGADKTLMIDLWAACLSADHAKANKVKHFVMVSSIGADAPSEGPEKMQPYLVAKHMADEHLKRSGLHYSIIRPGTLTDGEATEKFTSKRPSQKEEATITRTDVAKALLYCVTNPPKENMLKELFNGDENIARVLS